MQQKEGKVEPTRGGHVITQVTDKPVTEKLSQWLSLVASSQDKAAFTMLFRFFAPKIKNFGIKQFNDEQQANELVQDTMTNVWKKASLYDVRKGAATTWVYTVMRNSSFDQLRKLNSTATQNLSDDIWPLDQISNETVQSPVCRDHLLTKQLKSVVNNLPDAQRVVVKGVYYQELSQEQLSQQLGVPIGTIKSRLRLALKKIGQQMGEHKHD